MARRTGRSRKAWGRWRQRPGLRVLRRGLASLNIAARARQRRALARAAAGTMAVAMALQQEYEASGDIVFALVYRLEDAASRLAGAASACPPAAAGRPGDLRLAADALAEVTHLAQLAREWRQDAINLRHSLAASDSAGPQRDAILAGVRQLDLYVQQNMHDLGRWLQAAQRLAPKAARKAAMLALRA